MDFVAIDFETATSQGSSICSMGICVVEDNKIKEVKEILVRPTPFEFNDYNIAIHCITPEMVYDKPSFDKCWKDIRPYLQNKLVIAHNASFDVGAMRKALEMFGIELPSFDFICTVKLSQKAYPELASHKLNFLGDALGIDFSHHTACDDAYACAMVLLHILRDFGINSLQEIESEFDVGIDKIYPGYTPCKKKKRTRSSINSQQ